MKLDSKKIVVALVLGLVTALFTSGASAGFLDYSRSGSSSIVLENYTVAAQRQVVLSADSTSVAYAGATTLRWDISGFPAGVDCVFVEGSDKVELNNKITSVGSALTKSLTSGANFTLGCNDQSVPGASGYAYRSSVYISVGNQALPAEQALSVNQSLISAGGQVVVSWASKNSAVASCTLAGYMNGAEKFIWAGGKTGSFTSPSLDYDTDIYLQCGGPYMASPNSFDEKVSVKVALACTPATQTVKVGTTDAHLKALGGSGNYKWTVIGATSQNSAYATGSGQGFSPEFFVAGTYNVRLDNNSDSATCQVVATTSISRTVAPTLAVSVNGSSASTVFVDKNSVPSIYWDSANVSDCTISVTSGDVYNSGTKAEFKGRSGSALLFPITYTTTINGFCTGSSGNVSTQNIVQVNGVASVNLCAPNSQIVEQGQAVTFTSGAYLGSNVSWYAPDGSPYAGNGNTFTTSFSNTGIKYVVATAGSVGKQFSETCSVEVVPAGYVNVQPRSTSTVDTGTNRNITNSNTPSSNFTTTRTGAFGTISRVRNFYGSLFR